MDNPKQEKQATCKNCGEAVEPCRQAGCCNLNQYCVGYVHVREDPYHTRHLCHLDPYRPHRPFVAEPSLPPEKAQEPHPCNDFIMSDSICVCGFKRSEHKLSGEGFRKLDNPAVRVDGMVVTSPEFTPSHHSSPAQAEVRGPECAHTHGCICKECGKPITGYHMPVIPEERFIRDEVEAYGEPAAPVKGEYIPGAKEYRDSLICDHDQIRTYYEPKPIPTPNYDWCAIDYDTYDGENSPIGYGPTREAAIVNLVEKLDFKTEARLTPQGARLINSGQVAIDRGSPKGTVSENLAASAKDLSGENSEARAGATHDSGPGKQQTPDASQAPAPLPEPAMPVMILNVLLEGKLHELQRRIQEFKTQL